jgi:SPP1 family phage portal protein
MITVDKDSNLTYKNLLNWIKEWEKDKARLTLQREMYENKKSDGSRVVKLPFVKKLVVTSSSAAVGEGVTIAAPKLTGTQKACFEAIQALFKAQTIIAQDRKIIKQGCIYGRGYELVYMSSDESPIPKTSMVSSENAFVVFDNTVEHNSLYGVRYERYTKDNLQYIIASVYDKENEYTEDIKISTEIALSEEILRYPKPHVFGRVPLTEYHNNPEEQGDAEQVIGLILDRSELHDLNLKDFKAIAKNYLKAKNAKLAGNTPEEKNESQKRMAESQRIEVTTDPNDAESDIGVLSKNESYVSITEFGGDIDGKIYDLAMIPNLSDDQFAGNQSGVALDLKLMPFKQMIADKDEEIEKLYKRRIKMYAKALATKEPSSYAEFNVSEVEVTINRDWSKNLLEIAQIISTLDSVQKFSDRTLVNLMPKVDYEDETAQIEKEQKQKQKNTDPTNQSAEWLAAMARLSAGASNNNSIIQGAPSAEGDMNNGGTAS